MRAPRRHRRGFTIAEVLVFSVIGGLVLYMTYDFFAASATQGRDLDRKLKAVQGSQLLLERLERDLKHLVYKKDQFELEVDEDRLGVSFYVFDGHRDDLSEGTIPIHKRVYRFDPATSRMTIDGSVYSPAVFRAIQFQLGDAGGGEHPVLTMRVGGVADDVAGLPEEDLDLRQRADFVSSVGLAAIADAKRDPFWRTSLKYEPR